MTIAVHGLTKTFDTINGPRHAVDHLSFEVRPGEIYGLLGPNGAGKTTTLRMILGLLPPTSGDVEVGGLQVSTRPAEIKRKIGLVSANTALYQWLTPREILEYFAELYGVAAEQIPVRIAELSKLLDFESFLDQRCATLSTGQGQRVNLARAMVHDPDVMLLDEPTRGLDIVGTQVIFEYARHLKSRGKSIILCTHQLEEAERFADRFGLLFRGRLQAEGTLEELRSRFGLNTLVDIFLNLMETSRMLPHAEAGVS